MFDFLSVVAFSLRFLHFCDVLWFVRLIQKLVSCDDWLLRLLLNLLFADIANAPHHLLIIFFVLLHFFTDELDVLNTDSVVACDVSIGRLFMEVVHNLIALGDGSQVAFVQNVTLQRDTVVDPLRLQVRPFNSHECSHQPIVRVKLHPFKHIHFEIGVAERPRLQLCNQINTAETYWGPLHFEQSYSLYDQHVFISVFIPFLERLTTIVSNVDQITIIIDLWTRPNRSLEY